MAKRKRTYRRRGRSRSASPRRRRSYRRGGGGGGYGIKPSHDDLKLMAGAGLYGFLEKAAKTDKDHVLNKVPKPVDQLGFTGNTALVLWLLSVATKNPWVRLGARSTAIVATYQLGHRGELFKQSGEFFQISGWGDDDVADAIEAHVGALDPYGPTAY